MSCQSSSLKAINLMSGFTDCQTAYTRTTPVSKFRLCASTKRALPLIYHNYISYSYQSMLSHQLFYASSQCIYTWHYLMLCFHIQFSMIKTLDLIVFYLLKLVMKSSMHSVCFHFRFCSPCQMFMAFKSWSYFGMHFSLQSAAFPPLLPLPPPHF